jgi:hypothetical protein
VAGSAVSNVAFALLQARPRSASSVNGEGLAATSSDPIFAVNNAETVVAQGAAVKVGGTGFDTVHGVAIDQFCSCAGGKVGPFFLNPGDPRLIATTISCGNSNRRPTRRWPGTAKRHGAKARAEAACDAFAVAPNVLRRRIARLEKRGKFSARRLVDRAGRPERRIGLGG